MEVKKDILWRVYLSFIGIALVCFVIIGKAFYIQQVQGKYWRGMSDSLHQRIEEIDAERGTIFSENGEMLSTSIPQFDVYIDFAAEGLREKSGKRFRENLDSLSFCLSQLFKDKTEAEYKALLNKGYNGKKRYYPLKKNVSYRDYQLLKTLPLVRLGRNKSGFITEDKNIRLNPYKMLAFRTIGLARDSFKVGLEMTYDSLLKGRIGKRLVRSIAGGVAVPVDDYQIEPESGKDIVTTLDVFIQEVTENALLKMMEKNEAENGCAIVMETKTGKIKAIANLGRKNDNSYFEDFNYAISPSEPGSTFKLITLLSLLEDKKVTLNSVVNLQGGVWNINGRTVYDSEIHGKGEVTVKQAFELSSNVGMAKLAWNGYASAPSKFIRHLQALNIDKPTGIDITGERRPTMYKPGDKHWSSITLPWMAFGYNLLITPLQTLSLYNAVANNGTMLKPYLLNAVQVEGKILKEFKPTVSIEKICSNETLAQLKESLEGVCIEGTAKRLFNNTPYKVAGKTGTALVANGNKGYTEKIYQSSFAGYFPAEDPQYTIIVVIKNKPFAANYYGASVAGPVFKEIADRLYTTRIKHAAPNIDSLNSSDSVLYSFAGNKNDIEQITKGLQIKLNDQSLLEDDWLNVALKNKTAIAKKKNVATNRMPTLRGLGLKDAITICENMGLKVSVKGKGRVINQSLSEGQLIARGQVINIELGSL
ncbi:MAG: transpeptidase family protein [Chitinophagaceae bacterium]|nr:transpeptidase family protein [Chitinophagaceae bacterium]MCW5904836.1 transpeptidase family protein [Chitinophagaceae bacterium]